MSGGLFLRGGLTAHPCGQMCFGPLRCSTKTTPAELGSCDSAAPVVACALLWILRAQVAASQAVASSSPTRSTAQSGRTIPFLCVGVLSTTDATTQRCSVSLNLTPNSGVAALRGTYVTGTTSMPVVPSSTAFALPIGAAASASSSIDGSNVSVTAGSAFCVAIQSNFASFIFCFCWPEDS